MLCVENYNACVVAVNLKVVGLCYDHNFLRFSPIFGEKIAFFLNTNVMINFCQNLALFCAKNAIFSLNFSAKIFKKS
jgi:hypothetical protein